MAAESPQTTLSALENHLPLPSLLCFIIPSGLIPGSSCQGGEKKQFSERVLFSSFKEFKHGILVVCPISDGRTRGSVCNRKPSEFDWLVVGRPAPLCAEKKNKIDIMSTASYCIYIHNPNFLPYNYYIIVVFLGFHRYR